LALIFTAFWTPYEVAFAGGNGGLIEASVGITVVNRLIDAVFMVDICLQFTLAYPTESGVWVSDPRLIVLHYATSWFVLDLASVFPFWAIRTDAAGGGAGRLQMVRLIRLLRLVKLARLLRGMRIFQRWESRMSVPMGLLTLAKCMVQLVVLTHWQACIWGLQTTFYTTPMDTWLGAFDFCVASDTQDPAVHTDCDLTGAPELHSCCSPPSNLYIASIYWSIVTITSVGYGDISASNSSERIVATTLILLGAMTWGLVIATFCGVIATLYPDRIAFMQTLDDLNRFLAKNDIPDQTRRDLREYFLQTRHLQLAESQRHLLSKMSPKLQSDVAVFTSRWMFDVWFFKEVEFECLVQVALRVHAFVFTPGELAPTGYLYVVRRGLAIYCGRSLRQGMTWGEDMILSSEGLRNQMCARAMSYLEVYMINRAELLQIASQYPTSYKFLRRCAMRLAFRRGVQLVCRAVREDPGILVDASSEALARIQLLNQGVVTSEVQLQQTLLQALVSIRAGDAGGSSSSLVSQEASLSHGPQGKMPRGQASEGFQALDLKVESLAKLVHSTRDDLGGRMGAIQRQLTTLLAEVRRRPDPSASGAEGLHPETSMSHRQELLDHRREDRPTRERACSKRLSCSKSGLATPGANGGSDSGAHCVPSELPQESLLHA